MQAAAAGLDLRLPCHKNHNAGPVDPAQPTGLVESYCNDGMHCAGNQAQTSKFVQAGFAPDGSDDLLQQFPKATLFANSNQYSGSAQVASQVVIRN